MKLFSYEAFYQRVDIARWAAYAVTLGAGLVWAAVGASGVAEFFARAAVGCVLMLLLRLALARLGTSRLAASLGAILSFLLIADAGLQQLLQMSVLVGLLIVCIEFSKCPSKELTLVLGLAAGSVAALFSDRSAMVLTFVALFVGARLLWRLGLEKASRLSLLLFIAKVFAVVGVAVLTHWALGKYAQDVWTDVAFIPIPTVPLWLLIIGGILVVRGIWGSLLVATTRSPIDRKHRLFFAFFGIVTLALTWFIMHYGARIFTHGALLGLEAAGLNAYTVQGQIAGLFALLLFATNGIDRSLYHTTLLARRLVPSRYR